MRKTGPYYATILSFGSFDGFTNTLLLLDTASPQTWVQCEGCDPCIEFKGKNFSYTNSPTFERMRLDDPLCYERKSYEGSCGYETYFGHGDTIGFVGKDNFYLNDAKTGQTSTYPGLAFGCGLKNKGIEFGDPENNLISGIHGLAPGTRSFLTQLDPYIKGRFSYCLPKWTETREATWMSFGNDAQISGDDTRIVQTISMHKLLRYHLYLDGISVDGTRVAIDPSVFELDPTTYQKGFFIDSGSPYTYLVKSAFDPLKDAVAKYFAEKYNWQPTTTQQFLFELCYTNNPSSETIFPLVIFHFQRIGQGEVDWAMDASHMFELLDNRQGFCMTIFSIDDPGPNTFGAYQQIDFRILYDVANGLLSFVPETCLQPSS